MGKSLDILSNQESSTESIVVSILESYGLGPEHPEHKAIRDQALAIIESIYASPLLTPSSEQVIETTLTVLLSHLIDDMFDKAEVLLEPVNTNAGFDLILIIQRFLDSQITSQAEAEFIGQMQLWLRSPAFNRYQDLIDGRVRYMMQMDISAQFGWYHEVAKMCLGGIVTNAGVFLEQFFAHQEENLGGAKLLKKNIYGIQLQKFKSSNYAVNQYRLSLLYRAFTAKLIQPSSAYLTNSSLYYFITTEERGFATNGVVPGSSVRLAGLSYEKILELVISQTSGGQGWFMNQRPGQLSEQDIHIRTALTTIRNAIAGAFVYDDNSFSEGNSYVGLNGNHENGINLNAEADANYIFEYISKHFQDLMLLAKMYPDNDEVFATVKLVIGVCQHFSRSMHIQWEDVRNAVFSDIPEGDARLVLAQLLLPSTVYNSEIDHLAQIKLEELGLQMEALAKQMLGWFQAKLGPHDIISMRNRNKIDPLHPALSQLKAARRWAKSMTPIATEAYQSLRDYITRQIQANSTN